MNYIFHILVLLEIYMILALSANQKMGYSGLLSLGQAVFYGTGAYITAIAMTKFSFSYWQSLPLSFLACIIMSFIFSFIASKVRDLYFSLATLSIQIIFYSIIYNWIEVTNGSSGIKNGIYRPIVFNYKINSIIDFAIFGGFFLILIIIFYLWFVKTPLFRLIQATRDDQIAVLSFGKNPTYYKRVSIAISSLLAGFAGTLFASYMLSIEPGSFTLDESILILSIVLIGGAVNLKGSFVGVFIFVLLPEILNFINIPNTLAANLRMILFGLLLILIIRFKPNGIFGKHMI